MTPYSPTWKFTKSLLFQMAGVSQGDGDLHERLEKYLSVPENYQAFKKEAMKRHGVGPNKVQSVIGIFGFEEFTGVRKAKEG